MDLENVRDDKTKQFLSNILDEIGFVSVELGGELENLVNVYDFLDIKTEDNYLNLFRLTNDFKVGYNDVAKVWSAINLPSASLGEEISYSYNFNKKPSLYDVVAIHILDRELILSDRLQNCTETTCTLCGKRFHPLEKTYSNMGGKIEYNNIFEYVTQKLGILDFQKLGIACDECAKKMKK